MKNCSVLLLAFLSIPALAGNLDSKLPPLEGLVGCGCLVRGPILKINHSDPASRKRTVWSATFWAEHRDSLGAKPKRDWNLHYSYRKKRSKALQDCVRFLERVEKAKEGSGK